MRKKRASEKSTNTMTLRTREGTKDNPGEHVYAGSKSTRKERQFN
jgi:hypothetical protein